MDKQLLFHKQKTRADSISPSKIFTYHSDVNTIRHFVSKYWHAFMLDPKLAHLSNYKPVLNFGTKTLGDFFNQLGAGM